MAMFVHLTPEARVPAIRRAGIRAARISSEETPRGVHAVPVTRSFFVSHQWLRELKRKGSGPIAAVYFRVPDDTRVQVGHYLRPHAWMSAAEAVGWFTKAEDSLGWQVVVPRRIEAAEIHRTRRVPQVLGWRYWPGANGKPPFCTCKFCTRGEYGSARLRRRLGSDE